MLLKRILIASVVASLSVLAAACSDDAEDACEHMKEKCEQLKSLDCSKVNDEYDKLTDAQKEAQDKIIECIMDADSCDAIQKCGSGGGGDE